MIPEVVVLVCKVVVNGDLPISANNFSAVFIGAEDGLGWIFDVGLPVVSACIGVVDVADGAVLLLVIVAMRTDE